MNPVRIRAPIVVTRAATITASLSERVPSIRRLLDGDIDAAFTGDPAARSIAPGSVISQAVARSDRFGDGGGI